MLKPSAWLTFCVLIYSAPVDAQENPPPKLTTGELIERIIELQHEIDDLKAHLSPQALEQLRTRLAETQRAAPTALPPPTGAVAGETTPVVAEAALPAAAANLPAAAITEEVPAAEAPGPLPLLRRRNQRPACNTLHILDENADGKISSQDRNWRHLYLWTDKNADGQRQEREIESTYDRGVRELSLSLETFIRTKGGLGEMRLDEHIVLDLRGDGFSDRARRDDGILLLDATSIQRGEGPKLLGPEGEVLDGYQPFRPGLRLQSATGQVTSLNCP